MKSGKIGGLVREKLGKGQGKVREIDIELFVAAP